MDAKVEMSAPHSHIGQVSKAARSGVLGVGEMWGKGRVQSGGSKYSFGWKASAGGMVQDQLHYRKVSPEVRMEARGGVSGAKRPD